MSILDPQTMATPVATNQMIGLYAQDSVLGISKDTNWPIYRPALPSEAN